MAQTRAQLNRKVRQEALREQLAAGGHVEHVIDLVQKIANLDEEIDALSIQRLKAAADIKLKLIAKYLPDLKQTEMDITSGGLAVNEWHLHPTSAKADSTED